MMKEFTRLHICLIAAMAFISCSTTKVLQDDQYRLAKNRIEITNDKDFNSSSLNPYLKQKPNPSIIAGWNPFLSVYNWSNGKGGLWDRIVQKVGQEPVVYDADMVSSSVSNLLDHLEYQGYYGYIAIG